MLTGSEKVTAPAEEMLAVVSTMTPSSATLIPLRVATCHFLTFNEGSRLVSMLHAPSIGNVTFPINAAKLATPAFTPLEHFQIT